MAAECAVTLVRITVKPDVLGQKMLECLLKRTAPVRCCEECPKDFFEPAVFVSGKSQCSDVRIDCANRFQILIADIGERRSVRSPGFLRVQASCA